MSWEEKFSQIRSRINARREDLQNLKKSSSPISSFAEQQREIESVISSSISSVKQSVIREKERFYQTAMTKVQTISSALPIKGCGTEWLAEKKTYQVQLRKTQQAITMMCQEYVKDMEQQRTNIKQEMQVMQRWEAGKKGKMV
ncbi:MAG: hypothetical protein J6P19_07900 [Acetobacter sp.]|nr:hypothetical protein [Acetobacter sp.]